MQGKCVFSILTFCTLLLSSSCKNEAIAPEKLSGYWVLESATREGQATTTLEGTWLEFEPQGQKFLTNLPIGLTGSELYAITPKQITINGQPPLAFDVKNTTDSTLTLAFQTRGFSFTLDLRKSEKSVYVPLEAQPVEQ
jgi:hypothetical protein